MNLLSFALLPATNRTFKIINPATLSMIKEVPDCVHEVDKTIDNAVKGFQQWKLTHGRKRARILREWHTLILTHERDLASIIVHESGKPIREATAEVKYAASFVEWFSEEAAHIHSDVLPSSKSSMHMYTLKQPVGVAAMITPWNFPAAMITRKVAPALAAGCSCIVKPAPETPLTAIALMNLGIRAGIPENVFSVLPVSKEATPHVGQKLTSSPKIRKISFTGSTATGKWLSAASASTLKKLSLELGGNAPFIVFEDADLDLAVDKMIQCKFRFSGQTCISVNRVFLQSSIADQFTEKLKDRMKILKIGNGQNEDTDIGPLINGSAVEKMKRLIQDALEKGGQLLLGGNPLDRNFFEPTLIALCHPDMDLFKSEIFGPIIAVSTFETQQEVLFVANDTSMGLAGYLFTNNMTRIFEMADQMQVGMLGINESMISMDSIPFGGVKESGMGKEGSKYGIEEYLDMKLVALSHSKG